VRDHHDGAALAVELIEELEHFLSALGVEIARGLVGEQQRGLSHQRAGDRDALALAPGKLRRMVAEAVREPDGRDQLEAALAALAPRRAAVEQRHFDVLEHGELRDQVEGLEDESDRPVADPRQAIVIQPRDVLAVEHVASARGAVETPEDVHQRGLARARCADDAHEFAAPDLQIDPTQHGHRRIASAVFLLDALEAHDRVEHAR
jgi:hypothetical protein